MGVLLGGFIEGDPDQLEGATSYLAFIVPGLVAAHAMQTAVGETTYPVMGMFKWHKTYEGMAATPLQPRHLAGAHLMFVAFRLATTCGVFMLVLVPFGLFESWWGPLLAYLSQILVGMAFATLVYGLSCRMQRETGFGVLFRLGVFPLFLFSGAFFPVEQPRRRRRRHRPGSRRCGTASTCPGCSRSTTSTGASRRSTSPTWWRSRPGAGGGRSPASRSG